MAGIALVGDGFNSCPHAEGNLIIKSGTPEREVSIRALTRRATLWRERRRRWRDCFNSCPHAEGNKKIREVIDIGDVSIRALTRRATASS